MNREIKFRAWHGKHGMIYGAVQWHPAENGEWLLPCEDGNLVTADARPMQATGIKDRNGREIYEGDILRQRGQKRQVIFGQGVFWAWDKGGGQMELYIYADPLEEDTEVIGNIYEGVTP